MDGWVTIIVALVTTGSLGTAGAAIKKAWDARENAGYQRRKKEELQQESLDTIATLEEEVDQVTTDLTDAEHRITALEAFTAEQQVIIANQAATNLQQAGAIADLTTALAALGTKGGPVE